MDERGGRTDSPTTIASPRIIVAAKISFRTTEIGSEIAPPRFSRRSFLAAARKNKANAPPVVFPRKLDSARGGERVAGPGEFRETGDTDR